MKTPFYYRIIASLVEKLLNFNFSSKLFKKLKNKQLFFIQIGANDGVYQDPIYNFNENWDGILIEPIPNVFSQLKENYKNRNSNLIFENLAVGNRNGFIDFFIPKDYNEVDWKSKIASIDKSIGMLKDMETICINVEINTLDNIIKKHKVKKIDVLVIDIEGKEKDIFDTYSFSIKPKIIYFENRFLSYDEMLQLNSKFNDLGYRIFREKDNTLLILKN
jgi:FkbM family methyltransferase